MYARFPRFPRLAAVLFAVALAPAAPAVYAHDDATLDAKAAPNGGQVRMAGVYHLELVLGKSKALQQPVTLYVTDHADKKVPSRGLKASVVLFGAGSKTSVELTPDGDNRLKGIGAYVPGPELKALVSLVGADGKTVQARFTPFAASAPAPHAHGAHAH